MTFIRLHGFFVCLFALLLIYCCNLGCTERELNFDKFSCSDCTDTISKNSQWFFPFASTIIFFDKDFDSTNSFFKVDELGNFFHEQIDTLFELNASDFTSAISVNLNAVNLGSAFLISGASPSIDTFVFIPLVTSNNVRLKEVELNKGILSFILSNPTSNDTLECTLELLTTTGNTLTSTVNLNPNERDTIHFDLSQQSLYLGANSQQNYNHIGLRTYITNLDVNQNPATAVMFDVSFGNSVAFDNNIVLDWAFLRGYLGDFSFNFPTNIKALEIANLFSNNKIKFAEYKWQGSFLEINTMNSVGIPFYIDATQDYYKANSLVESLSINFFESVPILNGLPTNLTKRFDERIDAIMSLSPNSRTLNGSIQVNRLKSSTADTNQFINSTSTYSMLSRLHVPTHFSKLDTLQLTENILTGIGGMDTSLYAIDSAIIYLRGTNRFSTDANLTLVLKDETGATIDQIVVPSTINKAVVDNDGKVIQGKPFFIALELSKNDIDNLFKMSSVDLVLLLNISNLNTQASFSNKDNMELGLGVEILGRLKIPN